MNTTLSPVSTQPELFPLAIMAPHGYLLPATSGLTPLCPTDHPPRYQPAG